MMFEWDEEKDGANKKKHGVSFKEAQEIFEDPFHLSVLDKRFDYLDERWISIGNTRRERVIVVGHLYRIDESGTEIFRIITARKATEKERERYEKI